MSLQQFKRPRLIDKISAKEAIRLSTLEADHSEEESKEDITQLNSEESPKLESELDTKVEKKNKKLKKQ